MSVAAGVGCTDTEPNIESLIKLTDLDMYEQKNLYYQNYRSQFITNPLTSVPVFPHITASKNPIWI